MPGVQVLYPTGKESQTEYDRSDTRRGDDSATPACYFSRCENFNTGLQAPSATEPTSAADRTHDNDRCRRHCPPPPRRNINPKEMSGMDYFWIATGGSIPNLCPVS